MKMVFIAYNSAIDEEVMEALGRAGISNYTKWTQVLGRGEKSGPHLNSEVWPGVNSVLAIAVDDEKKDKLLFGIKILRQNLGKEGIKAFVLPVEEIT